MIAQLPASTAAEVGLWLACCVAVLGAVVLVLTGLNQWNTLTAPPPAPPEKKQEDLYVTHAQFDLFKVEYRRDLADLRADIKRDVERTSQNLEKQLSSLDTYTRDAFHRSATATQTIMNDLHYFKGTMDAARPRVPAEPL